MFIYKQNNDVQRPNQRDTITAYTFYNERYISMKYKNSPYLIIKAQSVGMLYQMQ